MKHKIDLINNCVGFVIIYLMFSLLGLNCYSQTVIRMERQGGIYFIPCVVNGLKLNFVFDTGASNISISLSEALFMLKNGYILENDIIGSSNYQIANGDIQEGTIINIRVLKIADKELHNVKALVVHSLSAPLLLGQSAIEQFGEFSIDYSDNTLTLGKSSKSLSTFKKPGKPSESYYDNSISRSYIEFKKKHKSYIFSSTDEALYITNIYRNADSILVNLSYKNIYSPDSWIYYTNMNPECIFHLIDAKTNDAYEPLLIEGITDNAFPPMKLSEERSFTILFIDIPKLIFKFHLVEGYDAGCDSKWAFYDLLIK